MAKRKKKPAPFELGELPPPEMVEHEWEAPTELPDQLGGVIGIDLETKDDGLSEKKGSGWPWGGGYVVGYSVSADNFRGYLPIRHEGGGNLDAGMVHRWLRHVLQRDERQLKVFANAMYDIGWASTDDIHIGGAIRDVLWAEALLDEHRRSYSLDSISEDRLDRKKDETLLRLAAGYYGYNPKSELWRMPAKYVGPYAEIDAELARELWAHQSPIIERERLEHVCELEHDLIPMYQHMRRTGIRVDVDRVDEQIEQLEGDIRRGTERLQSQLGLAIDIWSTASMAEAFRAEGLKPGTTATGKDSITQAVLEGYAGHWLADGILQIRKDDKLRGTFLEGVIKSNTHNGRVHGEIHPLRSDDGGTITGRLSMSNPNLQFIPVRTERGREIRRCFLAEEGEDWMSADFSQQEPRLLVHFASLVKDPEHGHLTGALEARKRYQDDPEMSYHKFAAQLTGLEYKRAKILNLAIIYGRGIKTTAEELDATIEETKRLFAKHNAEMPFARALSRVVQDSVRRKKYIRTLRGRKVRFYRGDPKNYFVEIANRNDPRWKGSVRPRDKFMEEFPRTGQKMAMLHKALNSLIQPSAADQTKEAMRALWQQENEYARRILVQVHDELCGSIPKGAEGDTIRERVKHVMENAVQLEVPVLVEADRMLNRWMGGDAPIGEPLIPPPSDDYNSKKDLKL